MSVFDGFADAMAAVPASELRLTFSEIECLIRCLIQYQSYLDQREDDEQPLEYASDGSSFRDLLDQLWSKFLKYQFH